MEQSTEKSKEEEKPIEGHGGPGTNVPQAPEPVSEENERLPNGLVLIKPKYL